MRRRPQAGAVLIVALVLLVAVGLISVAAMRGALGADQLAGGVRSRMLASQFAQIAIRYCERQLGQADFVLTAPADDDGDLHTPGPTHWRVLANWADPFQRHEVPAELMGSDASAFVPRQRPQCMAEQAWLEDGVTEVILVTARGFSPDYTADRRGWTRSGAVVWLQSMVRLG